LETLDDNMDINGDWKDRANIKISSKDSLGHYELKHQKLWFDNERSKLLDEWKQAKLQPFQQPRQMNGDDTDNAASEALSTNKRNI
jgi:hypothetical protein